ncbi:MAG: hypothetical protein ACOYD9_00540 [Pyramidobacter sp.]|jgi:hypothetical protein
MKKNLKFAAGLLSLLVWASAAFAAMSADQLMRTRSVLVWVGGNRIGDLMVGADAKLQFQFIDRPLAERIYSDPNSFPDLIVWNASYIDKASRGRCNLVLLIYKAMNRWNFDPGLIRVNGEPIDRKRLYTSLLSKPVGNLPEGTQDAIAFGVPRSISKPGAKILFSYGDYQSEFKVPEK